MPPQDENSNPQTTTTPPDNLTPGVTPTLPPADTPKPLEPMAPPPAGESSPQVLAPTMNKSGRNFKKLLIPLVILILVAVGAYFGLAARENDSKDSTDSQTKIVKNPIPVIRYGTQVGFLAAFYPEADSISSTSSFTIVRQVFEGLVGYGPNQKFVPLLATSWTNPDDQTWVFKLKSDVKFHNGKTMTAADVKASLEADTPSSSQYDFASVVKSIEAVDENTVKITTKAPDALFLNRLVSMFIYDTAAAEKNSPANGTGPFTLKPGTTYDNENIDLIAFDGYHGEKTLVGEIIGKNYESEEDLVAAAKEGKIDIGAVSSPTLGKDIVAANPKLTYREIVSQGSTVLQPITLKTSSPIAKKDVRLALYKAIDPSLVIKADGHDSEVADQIVPKTVVGYDPTIVRPKLDLTAAKKLLADAGYPNGIKLSVIYGPPSEAAIKEIGRQLAQIGVTLEYRQVKSFSEFTSDTLSLKYDLSYSTNLSDFFDASDIININLTKSGTIASYDNPAVNTLLGQAAQEFDAAKRVKLMQQISRTLMDDVAMIPIRTPLKSTLLQANYDAPFDVPDSAVGAYLSKFYQK